MLAILKAYCCLSHHQCVADGVAECHKVLFTAHIHANMRWQQPQRPDLPHLWHAAHCIHNQRLGVRGEMHVWLCNVQLQRMQCWEDG